jgi:alpha-tubulin suppressor-like RCC1 family protein
LLCLAAVIAGCGDPEGMAPGDAARDQSGAEVSDGGGPPFDLAPDLPPAVACTSNADCPARSFCGLASRACVGAVLQVVAGAHHSCARHVGGAVTCWGLAESLRGGGAAVLTPADMPAARGARLLAAGLHQTCAAGAGVGASCWGNQSFTVEKEDGAPLGQVTSLAVSNGFGCAGTDDGTHCWGKNDSGQLARPMELSQSGRAVRALPQKAMALGAGVAVVAHDGPGGQLCAWGSNATKMITASDVDSLYRTPQCRELTDVLELVAGDTHACVRRADGTVVCWGERYYGALGIGGADTADVGPPGAPTLVPGKVLGLAAGVSHTCVLREDGTVSCFGRNNFGQVGPDPGTPEEEVRDPVGVSGLPLPVTGLGSGSTAHHTCAIVSDGSLLCWGHNGSGQLGDGAVDRDPARFSARPVAVRF